MYAVAFAVDRTGDIYLDARLPLSAVTPDELDRLLGSVLTYADESFNAILELGFASSIRKEWEWRHLARRVDPQPRGVPRLARGRDRPEPLPGAGSVAAGVRRVSSTPTSASAPPTNARAGGTSSSSAQAMSVVMAGTRYVVSAELAGVGVRRARRPTW